MTNDPLPGTWHLVRWEITCDDGRPTGYPFGPDATGLLHYTQDGGMAASIARANRSPLSSASARSAPESERLAAFESYFQYSGTYRLQERDGKRQVVHAVTHALNPNFVGTEQVRDMQITDGTLTLSATDLVPGSDVARHHRLIWRR